MDKRKQTPDRGIENKTKKAPNKKTSSRGKNKDLNQSKTHTYIFAILAITVGIIGWFGTKGDKLNAVEAAIADNGGKVEKIFENNEWEYVYVSSDTEGKPVLAADGVLSYEDECSNTGRLVAGIVAVNPSSAREDILGFLDTAQTYTGVGRVYMFEGRELVNLASGEDSVGPAWFDQSGFGLCVEIQSLINNISDFQVLKTLVETKENVSLVEKAILEDDTKNDITRLVGRFKDEETKSRPELLLNENGFTILVRKTERGEPSIPVVSITLTKTGGGS